MIKLISIKILLLTTILSKSYLISQESIDFYSIKLKNGRSLKGYIESQDSSDIMIVDRRGVTSRIHISDIHFVRFQFN